MVSSFLLVLSGCGLLCGSVRLPIVCVYSMLCGGASPSNAYCICVPERSVNVWGQSPCQAWTLGLPLADLMGRPMPLIAHKLRSANKKVFFQIFFRFIDWGTYVTKKFLGIKKSCLSQFMSYQSEILSECRSHSSLQSAKISN